MFKEVLKDYLPLRGLQYTRFKKNSSFNEYNE